MCKGCSLAGCCGSRCVCDYRCYPCWKSELLDCVHSGPDWTPSTDGKYGPRRKYICLACEVSWKNKYTNKAITDSEHKEMSWKLPTDGPKTLNGLIIEYLEEIPKSNISLRIAGYPVEIIDVAGNKIKTVRVMPEHFIGESTEEE